MQRRANGYIQKRVLKMELPGRRKRGRSQKFMDEQQRTCRGSMEADESLWRPLKGAAERKERR